MRGLSGQIDQSIGDFVAYARLAWWGRELTNEDDGIGFNAKGRVWNQRLETTNRCLRGVGAFRRAVQTWSLIAVARPMRRHCRVEPGLEDHFHLHLRRGASVWQCGWSVSFWHHRKRRAATNCSASVWKLFVPQTQPRFNATSDPRQDPGPRKIAAVRLSCCDVRESSTYLSRRASLIRRTDPGCITGPTVLVQQAGR